MAAATQACMRAGMLKVLVTPAVRGRPTAFGPEGTASPPTVEQIQPTLRNAFQ